MGAIESSIQYGTKGGFVLITSIFTLVFAVLQIAVGILALPFGE